jgi:predicted transcriptional regulator
MSDAPLPTQQRIYSQIQNVPGIHFRELMRSCGVSTGQLSHHISALKRLQLIWEEKQGRNARFYPLGLNDSERHILRFLRSHTTRRILLLLLEHPSLAHKDLTGKMGLSPSTVSWHLEQLKNAGILSLEKKGKEHRYSITQKEEVRRVLIAHRQSFLDKLVDNFIDSWEE